MNNINKIVLYLSFVILAPWLADADTNYCDKSLCPHGGEHIGCKHNMQFSAHCLKEAKLVEMTPALQELIVDQFNTKRNLVAGGNAPNLNPACQMATMQWNPELAKLAELHLKKCEPEQDKCHSTKDFPYSGQNLAMLSFYGTPNNTDKITQAINTWYSEVANYANKLETTDHFTAMVLDRNFAVGCAASIYSTKGQKYKSYLVACNMAYNNIIGSDVYKTCRTPGKKCKTGGNTPKYPNLCSTSEKYDVKHKW